MATSGGFGSGLRCLLLLRRSLSTSAARGASKHPLNWPSPKPWNYLWKPGPYPVTQEAREAAARKYGLIPEDYEPYPDDGMGIGDYPKIKPSSGDSRSAFIDWDMPDEKRNYGEPLKYDWDFTTEARFDDTSRMVYTDAQLWAAFLVWILILFGPLVLFKDVMWFMPQCAKQVPFQGVKYYEFDTE